MQQLLLLGMLLQFTISYAQVANKSHTRQFVWPYELPANMDHGPMDINVKGEYHFQRETLGSRTFVRLHFKVTSLEFMPKIYSTLRYKYQGKIYRADQVHATDGKGIGDFENVRITSVTIEIWANSLNNPKKAYIGNHQAHYDVGDIDKDADLNNLTLNIVGSVLTDLNWTNSTTLENRLFNLEKLVQNRADYKDLVQQADEAFKSENWQEAKDLYSKASRLFPNEQYPKTQLGKIEKAVADAKQKEDEKKQNETATATGNETTSGSAAGADDPYWGNSLGKGQDAAGSGGTSLLSGKVKANGEYVQVFKQGGKHYLVKENGSTHEIPEDAYNTVMAADEKNKANQQANEQQKGDGWTMDDYNKAVADNQAKMDAKYAKIQKETEQLLNTVTSGIESFYAAQKVSGAKASLKQNSVLTGDYNTIEELEVAFYEQQDAINQSIQTLEAATNQQIQSSYNAFFGNSSAETQAWGTAAVGIANILSENSAERKKEQAMAELEASKKAKLKEIENKKIALRKDMRMALLAEFPQGGVPLSSHKVNADELYFFVYSYDEGTLESNDAPIVVSEIFPLAKYGDGTWPFTNSVMNEIKGLKEVKAMQLTGPLTLVGYYTTKELATQTRDSFLRLAQSSQMTSTGFTYKGKPYKAGSAATDFWGNDMKGGTTTAKTTEPANETATEKPAESGVDFWGNPTGKSEKTKTEEKPKTENESGVDFWGNPVKKTN